MTDEDCSASATSVIPRSSASSTPAPPTVAREEWNRRSEEKDFPWTPEPSAFLVAEVGSLPTGRALDLAAGEGANAVWLAEQGRGRPQPADMLCTADKVVDVLRGEPDIEKAGSAARPVKSEGGARHAIDCLVRGTRR